MFEQSLLLDDSVAKKSGAFAASLSAQILFTGVLILIPLAYQEVIPLVRLSIPIAAPVLTPPPPVEVIAQPQSSAPVLPHRPSRVFVLPVPRHVPTTTAEPLVDAINDAPPVVAFADGAAIGQVLPSGTGIARADIAAIPVRPVQPPISKADPAPVRIGGSVLSAQLLKKVVPVYPALALQARVSGTVRLEGILTKEGTIRNLQVLSGPPLLIRAALEAVQQWVYKPTLLNGVPVEVIAPIDVVFTLN
jgi:protein TonB